MKTIEYRAWDGKRIIPWSELGVINWVMKDFDVSDLFHFLIDEEGLLFMEYINLKDKNNKKIYEGDIIKAKEYKGSTTVIIDVVTYIPTAFYLGNSEDLLVCGLGDPEILGNIYENPELLKK